MNREDFTLQPSTLDRALECEEQTSKDCVKLIHPGDYVWFPKNSEGKIICPPCMAFIEAFEDKERRLKKRPVRRWRAHVQEVGQPMKMASFLHLDAAKAEVDRVTRNHGRAMVEDRWNLE